MFETMGLYGKSLMLVTERPPSWEYLLFAQVTIDEVEKAKLAFSEASTSINVSTWLTVSFDDFATWAAARLSEVTILYDQIANLVPGTHQDTFGPPGEPGDVSAIVSLARKMGFYYQRSLEWSRIVSVTPVDTRCREALRELAQFSHGITEGIEQFPYNIIEQIGRVLNAPRGDDAHVMDIALNINIPDLAGLMAAISRMSDRLEVRPTKPSTFGFHPAAPGTRDESGAPVIGVFGFSQAQAGYVYLMVNPSMEGLVKVGKTLRNPIDRAKELGAVTGVPTPFVLIFHAYVSDCSQAEKYIHSCLENRNSRVSQNREFFRILPNEAIEIMLEAKALFPAE